MSDNANGQQVASQIITGLLGIAFVVLKLCGVIDWSWWWVTLPFWGGLALVLVILFVVFVVAFIAGLFKKKNRRAYTTEELLKKYSAKSFTVNKDKKQ